MRKADHQIIAVALRDAKNELIQRGLTSTDAQDVLFVVEDYIKLALLADNPAGFDRKAFERDSYPYAEQEGDNDRAVAYVDRRRDEVAAAYSDELDAEDVQEVIEQYRRRYVKPGHPFHDQFID